MDFGRYFPVDPQTGKWGWQLLGAGRQIVPAGSPYPSKNHPASYYFGEDGRRTLDEFQVVFVPQGRGHFASASSPPQPVHAGDVLLLFPGEWHTYQPDPETGWSEYWMGFRGEEAARIMAAFFSPTQPHFAVNQGDLLIRHFDRLLDWLRRPASAHAQILASHIPMVLAFILSAKVQKLAPRSRESEIVMRAKTHILREVKAKTDFPALARELGLSYSSFRATFKQHTGYSPRAFENLLRLNQARDLLLRERMTVSETATTLGYASIYYFSRAYKKHFGHTPSQATHLPEGH